jgi:hypothetical protein
VPHLPIDPQKLTHVLHVLALAMAVSLALLFLFLIVQKLLVERARRYEDTMFRRLSDRMRSGEATGEPALDPHQLADRRALSRALSQAGGLASLRRLGGNPDYAELIRSLQRDARHPHWGRRAAAHEALGGLQIDGLLPFFIDAARQEDDARVFAACMTAAARLCRAREDLEALGALLSQKPALSRTFNEGILRAAFQALRVHCPVAVTDDRVAQYIEGLSSSDPLLGDALAAAAATGIVAALPLIERHAGRADGPAALRLTCIRALGRLKPDHPRLAAALDDGDWRVRAIAARHLRGTDAATVSALQACLRDQNFYVRRNAAYALFELGGSGQNALREAASQGDRYARDISRAVLDAQEQGNA